MHQKTFYLLIALAAALLFIPFLGLVHLFDWDEINFAECSREMIVTGNYARVMINFQPFWEKPPLFFWLQAVSMHLFGVNEFAARFPNALAGIATLLILFYLGNKLYNQKFALLWVLAYIGSFTPHFYFKSGIIDPLFNLFIFLSIYQLSLLGIAEKKSKRRSHSLWGGLFMGLAILTKGPVALLIVGLCGLIYWIMSRSWKTFQIQELVIYAFLAFIISSLWYLPETLTNGFWFLNRFIDYQYGLALRPQDTGHNQPIWYHPVVLLLGAFPASIYFLGAFGKQSSEGWTKHFGLWMKILFWVVLILFSLVKAKIIHYSSLCYFPMTFLAARYIYQVSEGKNRYAGWLNLLFIPVALLNALVIIAIPFINQLKPTLIPYIKDDFALAALQSEVPFIGIEWLLGFFFLVICFLVFFYYHRTGFYKGAVILFLTCGFTLQVAIYVYIPKIEQFTQKALIDYLKSIADEDAYKQTLNFQSYAPYFYGKVSPHSDNRRLDREWLLYGDIDKPAYLITRAGRDKYGEDERLKKVFEKNGFIVYRREAVKKK